MTDAQTGPSFPRRRRVVAVIGVLVLGIALVVLGVLFARSIGARLASARQLDRATEVAKEVDVDVVVIDRATRAPLSADSAESKALAARRIPAAKSRLELVVKLTDEAYQALNDDEREQAALLKATATARLEMMALAAPILEQDAGAVESSRLLSSGWNHLLAAKARSREAATQYNRLTRPAVLASNRLLTRTRSELASAYADFGSAQVAFPAFDAGAYLTHVDTLGKLNTLAMQSNTAWLRGQTVEANAITKRYNILEKQALEQATKLPPSPSRAIAEVYDATTADELRDYVAARKKATAADQRLRDL